MPELPEVEIVRQSLNKKIKGKIIKKVIVKIDFLAKERAIGVFHCSGDTDISYYDFAIEYVKELGYSKELVKEDFCKTKGVTPVRFTSLSSDC